eukprot:scaffold8020_cov163-Isochrysis_galbana.AAC.2
MERGGDVILTEGPNKGQTVYDPDFRPLVYPKDIRATVLRCAAHLLASCLRHCVHHTHCARLLPCRRKHPVLRMSYRDSEEVLPKMPATSVWSNIKSDVTAGNEGIYKRSYY